MTISSKANCETVKCILPDVTCICNTKRNFMSWCKYFTFKEIPQIHILFQRWESLSNDSLETVFGGNQIARSLIENDYLVLDQK